MPLIWGSASSPRIILLIFFTTLMLLSRGMGKEMICLILCSTEPNNTHIIGWYGYACPGHIHRGHCHCDYCIEYVWIHMLYNLLSSWIFKCEHRRLCHKAKSLWGFWFEIKWHSIHCKFFHGKFHRFWLCNKSHCSSIIISIDFDDKFDFFKIF